METKILILKSNEKLICNLEETDDEYIMNYPRKVSSINIIKKTNTLSVSYDTWCNLSYQEHINISKDWVVCVLDPHPDLVANYEEAIFSNDEQE